MPGPLPAVLGALVTVMLVKARVGLYTRYYTREGFLVLRPRSAMSDFRRPAERVVLAVKQPGDSLGNAAALAPCGTCGVVLAEVNGSP